MKFKGGKLATLRGNLSQESLANTLGIDRVVVSYLENGTRQPTISQLESINNYFGCPSEYFYTDIEIPVVKSAYRTTHLSGKSEQVLTHSKQFLLNLYEMNKLLAE